MRISHIGPAAILAFACFAPAPLQAQPGQRAPALPRPRVLVLGTYHMGGSSDFIQTSTDDVLSPRRQRELAELIESLAAFRPTKIMVEAPVVRDSALNARYRRYVAGQDTLRANEIDQIGFRLARRLGHSRVYAIDYRQDEDVQSVVQWAGQNGDTAFVRQVRDFARRLQAQSDSLRRMTITQYLRRLNSRAEDSLGHSAYLRMAAVGRDTIYVGADVLAGRYARNLKIFANLVRAATPGDRVLVIYGASHGKLLREFVRESGILELVDTQAYLTSRTETPRRR